MSRYPWAAIAALTIAAALTACSSPADTASVSEGNPAEPAGGEASEFLYYATAHELMTISTGGESPSTLATGFNQAGGIAATADGRILVTDLPDTDSLSHQIYYVAADGDTRTLLPASLEQSRLRTPRMAVDGEGSIYVSEDFRVVKISPDGSQITTAFDDADYPTGVAVDEQRNLFVTNKSNPALIKILNGEARGPKVPTTELIEPSALAASADGDVYIADRLGQRVIEVPANGTTGRTIENTGNTGWAPIDITITADNDIYVASEKDGGSLYFLDIDAGTSRQIAKDLGRIRGLASPRS